jgi:hypothetical protein
VSEVRYIELLGPAVLCGLRVTINHYMHSLWRLDAFRFRVLHQLRGTVRPSAYADTFSAPHTAGKTAQTDVRPG